MELSSEVIWNRAARANLDVAAGYILGTDVPAIKTLAGLIPAAL